MPSSLLQLHLTLNVRVHHSVLCSVLHSASLTLHSGVGSLVCSPLLVCLAVLLYLKVWNLATLSMYYGAWHMHETPAVLLDIACQCFCL